MGLGILALVILPFSDIFNAMPRRNLIWILILLAMVAVLLLTWRHPCPRPASEVSDFDQLSQVCELIQQQYYKPVDRAKMRRDAAAGMVDGLGEFSSYFPPGQARALTNRIMGQGCGVGLLVDWHQARQESDQPGRVGLAIIGAQPRSPAARADIDWANVRLLAIGDVQARSCNSARLRRLLHAPAGTKLKLTLLMPARDKKPARKKIVKLICEKYPIQTVQSLARTGLGRRAWRIPRSSLYYIRLAEFATTTPGELLAVLRRLKSPSGFVLDLRANPGGPLPAGVAAAEIFLSQGDIVTIVGKDGKEKVRRAHRDSPYETLPIVVLIDGQTSSAAELLAGALRANGRAVLVGSRTRGKGCVQTMLQLPGYLGQANLTTAEFFVERARPIQRRNNAKVWGVEPTLSVPVTRLQARSIEKWRTKLARAPGKTPGEKPQSQAQLRIAQDPQLAHAIKLLQRSEDYKKLLRKTHETKTKNNPRHRE